MPARPRHPWATLGLLALLAAGPASDLQTSVAGLAAADPAGRDAAEAHLAAAGTRAVPALSAAAADANPDVAGRARRALRRVRLFAARGVPDATLALANGYLSTANPAARELILGQLADVQPVPVAVLVRLSLLEPDPSLRAALLARVGPAYRSVIPALTAEGDGAGVDAVVEQAAERLPDVGPADYAARQFALGRWEDADGRWRAELANGDEVQQAHAAAVLFQLDRAAGRPAVEMARRSQEPNRAFEDALDRDDWPALSDLAGHWPGPMAAGLRAALAVLLHRPAAPASPGLSGADRVLLGDVAGGIAALSADPGPPGEPGGGDPVAAFRLCRFRGDYDAAFALAERYAGHPQVGPALAGPADDLRRLLGLLPPGPPVPVPTPSPDPGWDRAVADLAARRFAAAAADLAPRAADPTAVDQWYVRGYALAAAGDGAGGRSLMKTAAAVPLADPAVRAALADRLAEAGLSADAAEQRALAVRLASPFAGVGSVLQLDHARLSAATAAHDWATASTAADRVWLLSFWPGTGWVDAAQDLAVPADAHLARARLARSRDDWAAVAAELDAVHGLLPLGTEAAIEWVPALDAHGDAAAADARFAAVFDPLQAQCQRYPRSAFLHNQAAWLAACCCRRLDAAVAHAEAAVRLSPGDWQTLDTLAECRFRTADRAGATADERRAAALPGADAAYLARQLARFATAAVPSTTRPAAAPT